MSRRPFARPALALGLALAVVVLLVAGGPAGRAVLVVPVVLVLPGLALSLALWPRAGLGVFERLLLSVGLSLAVVILAGFVLHASPWGLQAGSWAGLLSLAIAGSAGVAWWRRRGDAGRPVAALARRALSGPAGLGLWQGLLLALALVVVVGAWSTARRGAAPPASAGFTELWMLSAGSGEAPAVKLGLRSQEAVPLRYRLQVLVDGQLLREWPSLELQPGREWEDVAAVPSQPAGAGPITAVLYRADAPAQVYRHVLIWPDPAGKP